MSTRSVVTLRGRGQVALYRHMDGYPVEAGAAIVTAILGQPGERQAADVEDVLARLLALRYDATPFRAAERMYSITTCAEDHGDIEHHYLVEHFTKRAADGITVTGREWVVAHEERRPWSSTSWNLTPYDLAGFVAMVNRERAHVNKQLPKYAEANKCAYTPYSMLEMPAKLAATGVANG